ncbi:unnamed protein product [Zymoseptoria tritici ST99CH_3D7]|uniref:Uncharacterized protein n=1 Tax=Zymoseptoria tritici (strain ST99CH_3D7) TaxID=1276538 RepID=A0A1X7S2R1_ZYMT9|nr:unnamed protein product [Zymoseptoria tritici ST99CH_3D7]
MVSQNKRRLRRNDKRLRRMEWEDERRKEPERMELARQAKKDTEIKMLARNERDRVDRELWYNSDTDALSHTARLLQRLPQELFDAIYEHVVSGVSESSIIKVEKHQYKPPMMLQITKPLRQKFMKTYYGTNIFSFTDPEVCSEWLETLAQDCTSLLKTIHYDTRSAKSSIGKETALFSMNSILRHLLHRLAPGFVLWQQDMEYSPSRRWPKAEVTSSSVTGSVRFHYTFAVPDERLGH